jgi:hypothetical protein
LKHHGNIAVWGGIALAAILVGSAAAVYPKIVSIIKSSTKYKKLQLNLNITEKYDI